MNAKLGEYFYQYQCEVDDEYIFLMDMDQIEEDFDIKEGRFYYKPGYYHIDDGWVDKHAMIDAMPNGAKTLSWCYVDDIQ